METIRTDAGKVTPQLTEHEMIALAETVLGSIPEWYLENKEAIENNRIEMASMAAELSSLLEEVCNKSSR